MTIGQLLDSISSRELTEWIAFYNVEAELEAEASKRAELEALAREGLRPRR